VLVTGAAGAGLIGRGEARAEPHLTWSTELNDSVRALHAAWVDGQGAYAVGDSGIILRRAVQGDRVTWSDETTGIDAALFAVTGDAHALYAVGARGTILRHDRARASAGWEIEPSGTAADLHGVTIVEGTLAFAVGAGGTVLKKALPDGAWSAMASGTRTDLRAVLSPRAQGALPDDVYAVGDSGTIIHLDDAWQAPRWTAQTSGTGADLSAITEVNGDVLVGGIGGVLLRQHRSSVSKLGAGLYFATPWTRESAGTTEDIVALASGQEVLSARGEASDAAVFVATQSGVVVGRSRPEGFERVGLVEEPWRLSGMATAPRDDGGIAGLADVYLVSGAGVVVHGTPRAL
jgi:hypothetical protein